MRVKDISICAYVVAYHRPFSGARVSGKCYFMLHLQQFLDSFEMGMEYNEKILYPQRSIFMNLQFSARSIKQNHPSSSADLLTPGYCDLSREGLQMNVTRRNGDGSLEAP